MMVGVGVWVVLLLEAPRCRGIPHHGPPPVVGLPTPPTLPPPPPGLETLPCWSATLGVLEVLLLRESEYMEWGRTLSPRLSFFRVRGGSPPGWLKGLVGDVGEEGRKTEEEEGEYRGEVGVWVEGEVTVLLMLAADGDVVVDLAELRACL